MLCIAVMGGNTAGKYGLRLHPPLNTQPAYGPRAPQVQPSFKSCIIFAALANCYYSSIVRMTTANTEIGKKTWLFAKLQPGRARKRINAT